MEPRLVAVNPLIRVLIIDDQQIVREGLRLLLENNENIAVVAEASSYDQAIEMAQESRPDIILLDLDLGSRSSGKNSIPEVLSASPESRILVLTGTHDADLQYQAIRFGASGLVNKFEASGTLLTAIQKIYSGEAWLSGALMAHVLHELWSLLEKHEVCQNGAPIRLTRAANLMVGSQNPVLPPIPAEDNDKISLLTNREREVIKLVGLGLRNQQIADQLYISVITVRHHLSSIFSKLQVSDRFELAVYAYKYGLAKLPIL